MFVCCTSFASLTKAIRRLKRRKDEKKCHETRRSYRKAIRESIQFFPSEEKSPESSHKLSKALKFRLGWDMCGTINEATRRRAASNTKFIVWKVNISQSLFIVLISDWGARTLYFPITIFLLTLERLVLSRFPSTNPTTYTSLHVPALCNEFSENLTDRRVEWDEKSFHNREGDGRGGLDFYEKKRKVGSIKSKIIWISLSSDDANSKANSKYIPSG